MEAKDDTVTVPDTYIGSWLNVTIAPNETGTIKITEPVEDMVVSYSDISEYRAEGKTAPAAPADGYLFAGWYTDEACTTAVATDVVEGAAYAKFVDARLMSVKAQVSVNAEEDGSRSIRFVTAVNDKSYSKVGFKVSYTKAGATEMTEKTYFDEIVYKQLTAMVDDDVKNYTPQGLICADATFFKAQILKGITEADFNTEISVTPYWETLDGTVVEGTTVTKKVIDGIQ